MDPVDDLGPDPSLHRVVERQLSRHGLTGSSPPPPEVWSAFLGSISRVFGDLEQDRYLIERSLEISSQEMTELYEGLRRTSEEERTRLDVLTEHSPLGILELDDEGYVLYQNPAWLEIVGLDVKALGISILDLIHGEERHVLDRELARAGQDGEAFGITVHHERPDGTLLWLRGQGRLLPGPERHWMVAVQDVSREVEARESTERLTTLLEAATDLVVVADPAGGLLHVNRIGRAMLGLGADASARDRSFLELFDPTSRERLRDRALPALVEDGRWRGDLRATPVGGEPLPMSVVLLAHGAAGQPFAYFSAIGRDISDLEEAKAALVRQATHDALTGLPNRVLAMDRLGHALERASRTGTMVAALFLDLDRFKVVNDSLGHEVGDVLLVEAAARLVASVRTQDTVARLGGDEFLVVCEDVEELATVEAIAERILDSLHEPLTLAGREVYVDASIGIALSRAVDDDAEALLRDADVAMYRAKDAGRGRYEVFDGAMRAWAAERLDTEVALRHAVERGEIEVHYQPEVTVSDGSLVGFEALVRWRRPGHGLVPPAGFVVLAEETGLIHELGAHVLERACDALVDWDASVPGRRDVRIAMNLSGRQLAHAGTAPTIRSIIDRTSVDPSRITLEITESVFLEDPDAARRVLEELRSIGLRIAIDDFGTGYSSLAYLQRFPIDIVKIDRFFVRELDGSTRGSEIVAAIAHLAHALGFEVVAEGVETVEQLAVLRELGVDLAQGYLFGRPVPWERAEELIRSRESSVSGGR
ncbi:MAG: EAL domain-containing protein [Acidimicrobiia bacterium]|nr:EAL domain-containing protein [Acidimicrobiia bacterium]